MNKRYLWVILAYICFVLSALYVIAPMLMNVFGIPKENAFLYAKLVFSILTAISILFLLKPDIKRGVSKDALPLKKSIKWMVVGFFMILVAQILAGLIQTYIFGIDAVPESKQSKTDILNNLSFILLLINFVTTVIFAPLFEEIMCRKIIFGTLYTKTNFFIASLVSSMAFAVAHFDFNHLLTYMASGFVLSWLYTKTKRIIVPIIAHSLMNSFFLLGMLLQ